MWSQRLHETGQNIGKHGTFRRNAALGWSLDRLACLELEDYGVAQILGVLSHRPCQQEGNMAPKKPTKAELRQAGKDRRNPRTPETNESQAAKILRQGRKK
jgi:hypothetical protein